MTANKVPRSVKGRDGWRFVFRDPGQTIRLKDYAPVNLSRSTRGSGPHYEGVSRYDSENRKKKAGKILTDALRELKEGRYIYGDIFVRLCMHHEVKITEAVRYKCLYMNELDLSIKSVRHKNSRGDFARPQFDGIFAAIQKLLAKTL